MPSEAVVRPPPPVAGLQVNVCKRPDCANFGRRPDPNAPAPVAPLPRHGFGARSFCDGRYATAVAGGAAHRLECLSCGESLPLKSNAAIAAEWSRLERPVAGVPSAGCPTPDCENAEASPTERPERYARYGATASGSRRLRCLCCERVFVPGRRRGPSRQPWLFEEYQAVERLLQHTPMRRILAGTGLNAGRLYPLLHRAAAAARGRMRSGDARAGRALADGPGMALSSDRQLYAVNWSDRGDRRKVLVHAVATADQRSGYVLAMDANYDPDIDPEVLAEAARASGDATRPPCERRGDAARVWLPEERNRRMAGLPEVGATTAGADAERRYRRARARADVEEPETAGRAPAKGGLVREDVSLYAHFLRVRRLLGTPPRVALYFEQESAMRAACMAAWGDRIRDGACEAYYIRIAKDRTAREKREIGAAAQARIEAVMAAEGCSALEARRRLVRDALTRMERRGPWQDRWLRHPCPSAFEPEKEVCRLTRRDPQENEAERPAVADGYAFASLHAADRFFMGIRYALNPLDRARASGRRHGRRGGPAHATDDKWDVYHPYNPAHVQALLDLQRLWWNWCAPGEDGRTPAMRLGLAARPIALADALESAGEDMSAVRRQAAALEAERQARRMRRRAVAEEARTVAPVAPTAGPSP